MTDSNSKAAQDSPPKTAPITFRFWPKVLIWIVIVVSGFTYLRSLVHVSPDAGQAGGVESAPAKAAAGPAVVHQPTPTSGGTKTETAGALIIEESAVEEFKFGQQTVTDPTPIQPETASSATLLATGELATPERADQPGVLTGKPVDSVVVHAEPSKIADGGEPALSVQASEMAIGVEKGADASKTGSLAADEKSEIPDVEEKISETPAVTAEAGQDISVPEENRELVIFEVEEGARAIEQKEVRDSVKAAGSSMLPATPEPVIAPIEPPAEAISESSVQGSSLSAEPTPLPAKAVPQPAAGIISAPTQRPSPQGTASRARFMAELRALQRQYQADMMKPNALRRGTPPFSSPGVQPRGNLSGPYPGDAYGPYGRRPSGYWTPNSQFSR